ncbi:hypothetical protein ACLOJK_030522 [Asimina triloba]
MDLYFEEEESWKCRKHPSQPRNGICPTCLRDRLLLLCPECATVRPCACYRHPPEFPSSTSPSSSSSKSSSAAVPVGMATGSASVGDVGRVSCLIDNEPPFRRSRSSALHFLRSRSARGSEPLQSPHPANSGRSLFRWLSRAEKPKRKPEAPKEMPRSRSIGIGCYSDSRDVPGGDAWLKVWGWHFPSPIKVFRQPRTAKLVHERSPLYRG